MEDMLRYLARNFDAAPAGKIQIIAVRHEDGSWAGETSHDYHEQRKKLFTELTRVSPGKIDDSASAEDPRETGNIYLDVASLVVSVVVPLVSAWISKEPREEKATLPGFVMIAAGGAVLKIDYRVPESERERLIEAFLREAEDRPQTS